MRKNIKRVASFTLMMTFVAFLAGCGQEQERQGQQAIEVKTIQVIQKDTPMVYVYAGEIQAKEEVSLQARVSGNIVAKMVEGGDVVKKGQPLFKIDSRPYESTLLSSQAELAQSQAILKNAEMDENRYANLAKQDAIAIQELDTQKSIRAQNRAAVAANRALVKKAKDDLNDTVIVSPINGRIDINDLSVGAFVSAGTTTMATVSSVDPVFVKFSMSENEYLRLVEKGKEKGALKKSGQDNVAGWDLKLTLSDGSTYPFRGKIAQVDKGLSDKTGTLTFKAVFANPDRILMPGMFGRVEMLTDVRKNAILVPQRAVQQILDETFITVVGKDNKAVSKKVKMGTKIEGLWLVEEGLSPNDVVVVEGLTKLQPGITLKPTMIGIDDLNNSSKK